jgi:hypothetical protein
MTMKTLLLDTYAWDLVLDASGNIALASEPYALAQDAASAIRTFLGECYYDTTQGIPYFSRVLGRLPSAQYLKGQFTAAALTVPDVATAKAFLRRIGTDRRLGGQVQITGKSGQTSAVSFPVG